MPVSDFGSDYARWGMEVSAISLADRLHRLVVPATKFRQSENDILRLHFLKLWEVDMAKQLVP